MQHDRRTFLRVLGAGSIGTTAVSAFSKKTDAATVIEVSGGGADIWSTADAFHYYYQEVSGDFDISVQNIGVESTDAWAKCGLMVRESLSPDAKNVMVRRRPNGESSVQWRPTVGAETTSTGGTDADWLRLKRTGETIETFASTDGSNWSLITTVTADTVDLSDSVYVGLPVTSHDVGTLCTATFQGLSGIDPDTSQDIGDVEVAGNVSVEEGVPTVSTDEPTDIDGGSATLRGELTDLGRADSAEVYFEYREIPSDSWAATNRVALTETGTFSIDTSDLTERRYYEVRAIAETTDGDDAVGPIVEFSTPGTSNSAASPKGPESVSRFDPDDGFADAAPWLDDDTPVIKITEPTREQLEAALKVDGERLVVFETSGTVDLKGDQLTVLNDRCYIAGQTAPSPGITFVGGRFFLDANDCVVRHIRVRKGTKGPKGEGPSDAIQTGDGTKNNVFDHVSASWGIDETFSVGYQTENTTVSNCLIAEGLRFPYPDQDTHYGTLVGDGSKNVALIGNVWAHNTNRLPRLKEGTTSVVVNNIAYHFEEAANMGETGTVYSSIVGNGYIRGNENSANIEGGNAYLADNYSADPETPMTDRVEKLDTRPLWPNGLDAISSSEVEEHNLANAGARPGDRTFTDKRIIEQVRNRTGSYIDTQEEVGGYPHLDVESRELDVPSGGTRTWLESHAVRVEQGGADSR